MKNKMIFHITVIIMIISFIAMVIISLCVPSEKELIECAVKEGRWAQFEECINPHPSDLRCDSCWNIYILQKPNKNRKYEK